MRKESPIGARACDELVGLKVDVIVVDTSASNSGREESDPTIPIVFTMANDPVGNGLVASLARPGGNITGLSLLTLDLRRKTTGASEGDVS